jgi:hypothetical protein
VFGAMQMARSTRLRMTSSPTCNGMNGAGCNPMAWDLTREICAPFPNFRVELAIRAIE